VHIGTHCTALCLPPYWPKRVSRHALHIILHTAHRVAYDGHVEGACFLHKTAGMLVVKIGLDAHLFMQDLWVYSVSVISDARSMTSAV
jgi:hypothetical protein